MLGFKVSDEVKSGGLLGLVALVIIWYLGRKAGAVVESAIDSVNPLNDDNIFYSGTNAIGESITGNPDWNLGGAVYETFNPDFDNDGVPDAGFTDVLAGMGESVALWFDWGGQ